LHKDVPIYEEWIGTLDAWRMRNVKAQSTGYLLKQAYAEGSFVKRGQLLFQIDPRPFSGILDSARMLLMEAQAQLANAEARNSRPAERGQVHAVAAEQLLPNKNLR